MFHTVAPLSVVHVQVMVFFDTDHDQCLNTSEFRSCVTGLGLVMTEEQITAKMAELDTTGDGKLNFDEFAHFMAVQVRCVQHGTDITGLLCLSSFCHLYAGVSVLPHACLQPRSPQRICLLGCCCRLCCCCFLRFDHLVKTTTAPHLIPVRYAHNMTRHRCLSPGAP
jgi:hypothetical protein